MAIPIFEAPRRSDIWLYDVARRTTSRFTFPSRSGRTQWNNSPRWTPDGQHIVYASEVLRDDERMGTEPRFNLFWKPADGSREAVPLTPGGAPTPMWPDSFSPDGSVLAFYQNSPETGADLWTLRLKGVDPYTTGPIEPEIFVRTRFGETFARFSPDGRWAAYQTFESGRSEVFIRPFADPGGKVQVSREGGLNPLWNPNGKELFYSSDDSWNAVDVSLTPSLELGKPRLLFEGEFVDLQGFNYSISPDGERFLAVHNPAQLEPRRKLTVITNFLDELQRRLPSGPPEER